MPLAPYFDKHVDYACVPVGVLYAHHETGLWHQRPKFVSDQEVVRCKPVRPLHP